MCQRTHIQIHAYANKIERTYVRDVGQFLNPRHFSRSENLEEFLLET